MPQAELEQAVTQSMRISHFGPTVDFTTAPPAMFTSPYRVVMGFNVASHHTEAKLYRVNHGIESRTGDRVRVAL